MHLGISPCTLENIQLLPSIQLFDDGIQRPPDFGRRAVRVRPVGTAGTLYGKHDFVGVFGVLGKVALEKDGTVVIGRAVEFAAVPEVETQGEGGAEGGEGLVLVNGVGAPGEAWGFFILVIGGFVGRKWVCVCARV